MGGTVFKRMPELPEVETIRQDLRAKILGQLIVEVRIFYDKVARDKKTEIIHELVGASFDEVDRVGKLIMFRLNRDEKFLLLHLKMTGQLIYRVGNKIFGGGHSFSELETDLPNKHTQLALIFKDGSTLYFNDMRRFGYVKIVDAAELETVRVKYGIEPLTKDFTYEAFLQLLTKKKMVLKALLLNQAFIAGIGNIYADEICYAAGVLPTRRTPTLSKEEIKNLYQSTEAILKKAIAFRGTTFNNYVDSDGKTGNFSEHLQVYERKGEQCKRCKDGVIAKTRSVGRGTYYCPLCQK
jgi:formamidopyrimidine-DNA glycosylase